MKLKHELEKDKKYYYIEEENEQMYLRELLHNKPTIELNRENIEDINFVSLKLERTIVFSESGGGEFEILEEVDNFILSASRIFYEWNNAFFEKELLDEKITDLITKYRDKKIGAKCIEEALKEFKNRKGGKERWD